MVLVNMYDCTARPTSTGEEVPQCHNLHATVKNIITRSFANMPPESVLDGTGAECNSSLSNCDVRERTNMYARCIRAYAVIAVGYGVLGAMYGSDRLSLPTRAAGGCQP